MALFGRRKDSTPPVADDVEAGPTPAPEGRPGVDRDWERSVDGPFDLSERPELESRIDLGPLRVPGRQGMEMRLDVEQGTSRMVGLTCAVGPNKVQIQAFAAPRSLGIWAEIREALAEGITTAGGTVQTAEGVLGPELRTRTPGRAADGRVAYQPVRFLGVDGPRWFLRVVVNGPAASDDTALQEVLDFVREIVVDRGEEPKPPRELLELKPPQNVLEAAARRRAAAKAAAATAPTATAQAAAAQTDDAAPAPAATASPAPGDDAAPAQTDDAPPAPSDDAPPAQTQPTEATRTPAPGVPLREHSPDPVATPAPGTPPVTGPADEGPAGPERGR